MGWLMIAVLVLAAALGGCLLRVAHATEDYDALLPDLDSLQ